DVVQAAGVEVDQGDLTGVRLEADALLEQPHRPAEQVRGHGGAVHGTPRGCGRRHQFGGRVAARNSSKVLASTAASSQRVRRLTSWVAWINATKSSGTCALQRFSSSRRTFAR